MNASDDIRTKIFCSHEGPDIFQSVQYANNIGESDPYDVEEIHNEAREIFQRQLNIATTPEESPSGCSILILGESGSGKTHLMRAFRNYAHSKELGYFAYMQMTTSAKDYGRYILRNLLTSFDTPYYLPNQTSALIRLSNCLIEYNDVISKDEIDKLRESELDCESLGQQVYDLTMKVLRTKQLEKIDSQIISALLYLQVNYPEIRHSVSRYLRCESMTDFDGQTLKAIGTKNREDADPLQVIENIGKLIRITQGASLLICIDQLEDIMDANEIKEGKTRFRNAIATINTLLGRIPSSIMIISCLEDYYETLKESLTKAASDRLENDPCPILISGSRTKEEVELIISYRLKYLFETHNIEFKESEPIYPFNQTFVESFKDMRTRDVLIHCKKYREKCAETGQLIEQQPDPIIAPPILPPSEIEQKWNDFQTGFSPPIPIDETELAAILEWAIKACCEEIEHPNLVKSTTIKGRMIVAETFNNLMLFGICNKNSKGGSLKKQIDELENQAKNDSRLPFIIRSTDFPSNPKTQIAQQLGDFITRGGRRVVVQDSDWRIILSMQEFLKYHKGSEKIKLWQKSQQHLCKIHSLKVILDLDNLLTKHKSELETEPVETPTPENLTKDVPSHENDRADIRNTITDKDSGYLHIGVDADNLKKSVTLDLKIFTRHAVFLGGTGSGKTTIALNIVEQLLLRGIPTILLDRKGDLCGYAKKEFLETKMGTANLEFRKEKFGKQIDVVVYTPGDLRGRPLAISVIPDGINQLSPFEREQASRFTAEALGGMMEYKSRTERNRIPILAKAIDILAQTDDMNNIDILRLIEFISKTDPALINAVGQFDQNLFKKLAEDLQLLKLNAEPLLLGKEKLDTETLLGLKDSSSSGKTRLSIISTKFLGDIKKVQFWVAQLLLEVSRWASKHPSDKLQAVLLFDEADLYLPATSKPSTKEPMENLLKRARSAGIGLFLVSQNPGDFDYKCRDNIRTWLVGRVQEKNSLLKMKPMFDDYQASAIESKLSGQKAGEFHLLFEKTVQPLKADMSLLKTEQLSEKAILEISRWDKQIKKIVTCPKCNKKYKTEKYSGKKRECPNCKEKVVFVLEEV